MTYLSAIGGVGYLGYVIYLLRNPNEQFNPDPSKKTLVILGAQRLSVRDGPLIDMSQAPDGALSPYSKSSTPKITMSS